MNVRVTVDKHHIVVADKCCKSHSKRKVQVLDSGTRDFRSTLHIYLGNLRVSESEEAGVAFIGIKQYLVDSARCEKFLIDGIADIEFLGKSEEL